jgi:hypothetical protein
MPDAASCLPPADYLELSGFGMFMSVDRQEFLAAIDKEIARLRRARFLKGLTGRKSKGPALGQGPL